MRKPCTDLGAAVVALVAVASGIGCGGQTTSSQGNDTGPLATCGDSCTPTEVSSACTDICDKIAQAKCSSGGGISCPTSCANITSMTPPCTSVAVAFLRCIENAQPTCSKP